MQTEEQQHTIPYLPERKTTSNLRRPPPPPQQEACLHRKFYFMCYVHTISTREHVKDNMHLKTCYTFID
jgi:hypothetical protein